MKPITKIITDPEIKSIDEKKRIIWHKITKEIKDRMGDIVRIDGLHTAQFRRKPAVLYGHMYGGYDPLPVIGENTGFRKEGKSLYAGTKFLNSNDLSDPKAKNLVDDLWLLNKKKLLGWSIGFIPLKTEDLKEGNKIVGKDFKESELLEYSNVIVPANAEAVNDAISKGIVTKELLRDEAAGSFYFKEIEEEKVDSNKLRFAKRLLEFCKYKLNMPDLWIQWVVECSQVDAMCQSRDRSFWGQVGEDDVNKILIRADASLYKIRVVIPHECHHQSMALEYGFPKTKDDYDIWERRADKFAEKILEDIRELYTDKNGNIYWPR